MAFHIRDGGQGAGFGKYAEEDNLLDVAWNVRSRGCIETDERLRAGYGIELGHNLKNNIGGYLDFHYNGSDSDYTSRIIETEAGKLQVYGDLSVSGKLNGLYIKTGSKVFQTTAANAIPIFTSDDLNTLFGTSGVAWGMSNSVCFFANGAWEAQSIPVCAACNHNVWNMVSTTGENFGDGSWFRVSYLVIGWT